MMFLLMCLVIISTFAASNGDGGPKIILYEHGGQSGSQTSVNGPMEYLESEWNDVVSSVYAVRGDWELYTDASYTGAREVVTEGNKIDVSHNDEYSSVRPLCKYEKNPDTAKLIVYEHGNFGGKSKEFFVDVPYLEDWNDIISSVRAETGDWELFGDASYEGDRYVVKEGQSLNVPGNDQYSSLRPVCESYQRGQTGQCNKINGVPGACNLDLNHFTLAGTHNSGSGAYGLLYYWSGIVTASCWYRNQDKSITQQLELGIRYFDFDIAHVPYSSGSWWEKGIVLVHCNGGTCAYSRSLRRALREIDEFLGKNRNEIVLIRFKDYLEWSKDYIMKNLADEVLGIFQNSPNVRINPNPNPRLGDAIESNQRLVVLTNGGLHQSKPFNNLVQVESYNYNGGQEGTFVCYSVEDIMKQLKRNPARLRSTYYPVQVDWYYTMGLCLWDLAHLCDGDQLRTIVEINEEVVREAGRPITLVAIDYAGSGNVRLSDIVKEINESNVRRYA